MIRSLAIASDVLTQSGLSLFETHPDRFILRTPDEPNYWFGNAVIFRENKVAPAAQIAQFRHDFPKAAHIVLMWDVPDMPEHPEFAELQQMGFELDRSDVLTLRGSHVPHAAPAGLVFRPLESDTDWAQATDLQHETACEQGFSGAYHRTYIEGRMTARRRQVADGLGVWMGAFEGALLVADMGLFADDRIARFQSVETRKSHRRRGICAALVGATCDWARANRATATPVIIADTEGAPGRVYRSCGFALTETSISAYRGPKTDRA